MELPEFDKRFLTNYPREGKALAASIEALKQIKSYHSSTWVFQGPLVASDALKKIEGFLMPKEANYIEPPEKWK